MLLSSSSPSEASVLAQSYSRSDTELMPVLPTKPSRRIASLMGADARAGCRETQGWDQSESTMTRLCPSTGSSRYAGAHVNASSNCLAVRFPLTRLAWLTTRPCPSTMTAPTSRTSSVLLRSVDIPWRRSAVAKFGRSFPAVQYLS